MIPQSSLIVTFIFSVLEAHYTTFICITLINGPTQGTILQSLIDSVILNDQVIAYKTNDITFLDLKKQENSKILTR